MDLALTQNCQGPKILKCWPEIQISVTRKKEKFLFSKTTQHLFKCLSYFKLRPKTLSIKNATACFCDCQTQVAKLLTAFATNLVVQFSFHP